jgi:hypothetical protein
LEWAEIMTYNLHLLLFLSLLFMKRLFICHIENSQFGNCIFTQGLKFFIVGKRGNEQLLSKLKIYFLHNRLFSYISKVGVLRCDMKNRCRKFSFEKTLQKKLCTF